MKFATPKELETESSGDDETDVSVVDPTEATVDLPELGTVTVAEALAEHDDEIVVARGMGEGALERLEQQQETIQRQQEQIEELREAIEMVSREGLGLDIDWVTEGWE